VETTPRRQHRRRFRRLGTLLLVVLIDRTLGFRLARNDAIEGLNAGV
jgi:hypothetical protein